MFFVSPSQQFSPSVETTDHPIEDGSTVTDHAQSQPLTIGVQGIVSATPLVGPDQTVSGDLLRDAVDFFGRAEEKPLRLETDRLGDFGTVLLESYDHEVTPQNKLVFELEFKEVKFATFETVEIPPEAPSGEGGADSEMPDEQDVGSQPLGDPFEVDTIADFGRLSTDPDLAKPDGKKQSDQQVADSYLARGGKSLGAF